MRWCRVCGCTNSTPCIDGLGQACAWVGPDLCSFCCEGTPDDEPLVRVCAEGQVSAFIRAMRQDSAVARVEGRVGTALERCLSAGGGV
jgi:hypothetical protein